MQHNGTRALIDFSDYIDERTKGFTGREWVFRTMNEWLASSDGPRCFLLIGAPGSGKTAIASRLNQFSQGKVHPPEDLTYLTPNFLSAVHFCSAHDRRWINPHTFAKSLALQLADYYPTYAKALAGKSVDEPIHIEVDQRVQHMEGGQVTGVVIKNLEVKETKAENAFSLLVREPLEALYREGYDKQIVILVDALDEALLYGGEEVGIIPLERIQR